PGPRPGPGRAHRAGGVRSGPRPHLVRQGPGADAVARPAQRRVRGGHGGNLLPAARAHRREPGRRAHPPGLAVRAGEGRRGGQVAGHRCGAAAAPPATPARRSTRSRPVTGQAAAPHVAVVGGGLAGITAAIALAETGTRVTLLESRPRLGGATSSFSRGGLTVDNGQHVFLRCCTAYRGLLARLGMTGSVTMQDRFDVTVLRPGGPGPPRPPAAPPPPPHGPGPAPRRPPSSYP